MTLRKHIAPVILLFSCGCAGVAPSTPIPRPRAPVPAAVIDADYRVGAGDILTIDRVGETEPEQFTVGRDGSIQLTGTNVRVDGMSAQEISVTLRRELGWEYQNCHVEVSQANSQFIQLFVDGKSAQAIPYRGRETVEDMLTRSDCPSCRRGYRVRVVRPGKAIGQLPEIFAFQIDSELKDRPTGREPVLLEPNDYVYLERDRGRPGELTRMTESRWYQKPGQWARQLRQQSKHDSAMAQRQ